MASYAHPFHHPRPDNALPEPGTKLHRQSGQHRQCLQPMTHERQIALVAEARAARLRDHGPQEAESEREYGEKQQR